MLANVMSWVFALSVVSAGQQGKVVDAGYLEPHYSASRSHLYLPHEGLSIVFENAGYVDAPDGRYWLKRIEFAPDYRRDSAALKLVHEDSRGNILRLMVRCNARQHGMLQNLFVDLLVPVENGTDGRVADVRTLFPQGQPRFMSRKLASQQTGSGLVAETWQAITPKSRAI